MGTVPNKLAISRTFRYINKGNDPITVRRVVSLVGPRNAVSLLKISRCPIRVGAHVILRGKLHLFNSSHDNITSFRGAMTVCRSGPRVVSCLNGLVDSMGAIHAITSVGTTFRGSAGGTFNGAVVG